MMKAPPVAYHCRSKWPDDSASKLRMYRKASAPTALLSHWKKASLVIRCRSCSSRVYGRSRPCSACARIGTTRKTTRWPLAISSTLTALSAVISKMVATGASSKRAVTAGICRSIHMTTATIVTVAHSETATISADESH